MMGLLKINYAFILLIFLGLSGVCSATAAPPNIIVFLADDVDWKDFGCYGNDAIRTPNIDALAKRGLKFENAFLTVAQCSPTRISILTGRYPHATGAEDLHMPLPEGMKIIPTHLKEAGYFSGHMKKTHYGKFGSQQFDWYDKGLTRFGDFLDATEENPFFSMGRLYRCASSLCRGRGDTAARSCASKSSGVFGGYTGDP